jgi:hypothetical protein
MSNGIIFNKLLSAFYPDYQDQYQFNVHAIT